VKAVEFHVANGDFESWAKYSLKDQRIAAKIKETKALELKGEKLRKALLTVTKKRYVELSKQTQDATKLF
jgi:hypothetical protein